MPDHSVPPRSDAATRVALGTSMRSTLQQALPAPNPPPGFSNLVARIIRSPLRSREKLSLLALAVNVEWRTWSGPVSNERLERCASLGEQTLSDALKGLAAHDLVQRQCGSGRERSTYVLNHQAIMSLPGATWSEAEWRETHLKSAVQRSTEQRLSAESRDAGSSLSGLERPSSAPGERLNVPGTRPESGSSRTGQTGVSARNVDASPNRSEPAAQGHPSFERLERLESLVGELMNLMEQFADQLDGRLSPGPVEFQGGVNVGGVENTPSGKSGGVENRGGVLFGDPGSIQIDAIDQSIDPVGMQASSASSSSVDLQTSVTFPREIARGGALSTPLEAPSRAAERGQKTAVEGGQTPEPVDKYPLKGRDQDHLGIRNGHTDVVIHSMEHPSTSEPVDKGKDPYPSDREPSDACAEDSAEAIKSQGISPNLPNSSVTQESIRTESTTGGGAQTIPEQAPRFASPSRPFELELREFVQLGYASNHPRARAWQWHPGMLVAFETSILPACVHAGISPHSVLRKARAELQVRLGLQQDIAPLPVMAIQQALQKLGGDPLPRSTPRQHERSHRDQAVAGNRGLDASASAGRSMRVVEDPEYPTELSLEPFRQAALALGRSFDPERIGARLLKLGIRPLAAGAAP